MSRLGIKTKVLLPFVVLGVAITIWTAWYLVQFSHDQTTQATLESARGLASQIRELRGYYTKKVVGTAKRNNLQITHDYADRTDAIPLPATMVHELTGILSKKEGYSIRLYSGFPFPFRTDGGPRDTFEREALKELTANPNKPYWRQEVFKGVPSIRYASADLMVAQVCVDCHNSHPLTPKDDWKVGDLRGVLEVIKPVDVAIETAEGGARNVGLVLGVGILIALIVGGWNAHRTLSPLRRVEERAQNIADGDLQQDKLLVRTQDEIGRLATCFNQMLERLQKLAGQAQVMADDDLDNPIFEEHVRGDLGEAFVAVVEKMKWVSGQASYIAAGDLHNQELRTEGSGSLGLSIATMVKNLRQQDKERSQLEEEVEQRAAEAQARSEEAEAQRRQVLEVAEKIANASSTVAFSAEQLSANSGQLSQGSEQQQQIVEGVASSIQEMAASARSVSSNTDNLARLVTDNSTALSELATSIVSETEKAEQMSRAVTNNSSSIEELAASIQTQAQGADQANQTARQASAAAQDGARVVRQAISGMERIAERVQASSATIGELGKSSEQISTIVAVINDIADQTNLLALNAAIEAARAGDQGRGFAVVADEVRKLAERTSKATQEIDEMIGRIQNETKVVVGSMEEGMREVEEGTQLASRSGEALEQIAQGVEQVNELIGQLSEATQEQARTSDEIVHSTTEMNQLVGEVTGAVGEQMQAVDKVSQSADEMQQLVGGVTESMKEQTGSAEHIAQSMEQVNQVVQNSQAALQKTDQSTTDLANQAESLKQLAAHFEEEDAGDGNGRADHVVSSDDTVQADGVT